MKKFKKYSKEEILFYIVNHSIFLTLILLPILFIPIKGLKDIYSAPRYVFLLVIAIITLIALAFNPKQIINKIELNKPNRLIIIFYIILTISLSYSIDIYLSLYGLSIWRDGYIVQFIFLILFFLSQLTNKLHKNILEYIVISACLVSLYGIAQSFGFDFVRDYHKDGLAVFSTMVNQNFLGTYLVLTIPFAFHLYLTKNNWLFLFAYGIIFFTLLETLTRGAWLGFIVSILFYLTLYVKKYSFKQLIKDKLLALFILSVTLLVIFEIRNEGILILRFLSIFSEANSLFKNNEINMLGSNRGYIWAKSIEYIKAKPLFGYGIQNIVLHFIADHSTEMKTLFGQIIVVNNVHNEYLQIALSTGIPSLLIYLAFIYQTLKVGLKKYVLSTSYLPIISAIVGYLVQAFFSLSFITVAYIFWIFLGLLVNKNDIFNQ